jgi:hypothetical protein
LSESTALQYGATINQTINASNNVTINSGGASHVLVHILTTSSLQFTVNLSVDGTNFATQRVINAKTGDETAAGTNITPSANDLYVIPTGGAEKCRIVRQAGSGTLSMRPVMAGESLADQTMLLGTSTNFIGATGPSIKEVAVTFTCVTGAQTAGDIIADSQVLTDAMRANDANGYLVGFVLNDQDDQGAATDVVFLSANQSLGTEGSTPNISDANADKILGVVEVAAADWKDFGGARIATKTMTSTGLPLPITPASGTDDVYVALVTQGTPTYTATGITGRFFFSHGV